MRRRRYGRADAFRGFSFLRFSLFVWREEVSDCAGPRCTHRSELAEPALRTRSQAARYSFHVYGSTIPIDFWFSRHKGALGLRVSGLSALCSAGCDGRVPPGKTFFCHHAMTVIGGEIVYAAPH